MLIKKRISKTIALVLLVTMISSLAAIFPITSAQESLTLNTYSCISATPNPVGVGQTVLVTMWLDKMPPTGAGFKLIVPWQFDITIDKPDGTTQESTYFSDVVGASWFEFTPDTVGTYYIHYEFPGQENVTTGGNSWAPSQSSTLELVVQQDAIVPYEEPPFPTGYWERPIYGEHRTWGWRAGNWLGIDFAGQNMYNASQNYNPYTEAPDAPHILWTKPIEFGGIVGGDLDGIQYYTGESYETKLQKAAIINGRLFRTVKLGASAWQGTECIDLYTGEQIWYKEGQLFNFAQVYDYESMNQHGAHAYLWQTGSTYKMYDAFSGTLILTMYNATTGPVVMDKHDGSVLVYLIDSQAGWFACWNSSQAILYGNVGSAGGGFGAGDPNWYRPAAGGTYDWSAGIMYNTTIPVTEYSLSCGAGSGGMITDDVMVAAGSTRNTWPPTVELAGYDLKTGNELWRHTNQYQEDPSWRAGGGVCIGEGVYTRYIKETKQWVAWDYYTGEYLWTSEPRVDDWGVYSGGWSSNIGYGKLYQGAYDGKVYAWDLETGEIEWVFYVGSSGFETPYGTYPTFGSIYGGMTLTGGNKLIVATGEHSPNAPTWHGWTMHLVDTNTGEEIWTLNGLYIDPMIADGYIVSMNGQDNQLYCIGIGESATTVTASPKVTALGSKIMIEGTVTDQSPGAAGTPAIADENIGDWMEYLYMQKPMPMNAKGVEVTLETVDPNGNWYEIGKVTSDSNGMFKLMWQPPVPGEYTIIANFVGSGAYGSSHAVTAVGVTEAPTPAQPIEPEPSVPEPTTESPLITTEVAIIAAVAAIIGVAAYLVIRKRRK